MKIIPIYKCWLIGYKGQRQKVEWETSNKEYAEEFARVKNEYYKEQGFGLHIEIEEVTHEEIS